ncbi:ABC transporter permease [Gottschalkiaceae bacterium SANA]|nr:ABC transporter permease [Gottschalkiaceae bacterium SANA]
MRSILWLKLRLLKRDYMILVILTAMALLLTGIFGGSMMGNYQPSILVVSQESSPEADRFLELMQTSETFRFEWADQADAIMRVESDEVMAALILPLGFGVDLKSSIAPSISLFQSKDALELMELKNWVRTMVFRMQSDQRMVDFSVENFQGDELGAKVLAEADTHWANKVPVVVHTTTKTTGFFDFYDIKIHYMVGFLLFFTTFSIVFTMADLLQEKKQFTWNRQMISPISKKKILAGNIFYSWCLGFMQALVLIGAGGFLFDIDWKAPLAVLLVLSMYILAIAGLGMLITGFVRTLEQLSAITPVILVSFAMLGGCMWPLESVSNPILLFAANLTPHKWALQAIERLVMFDASIETIGFPILVLAVMSLVFFVLGLWRFQKHAVS